MIDDSKKPDLTSAPEKTTANFSRRRAITGMAAMGILGAVDPKTQSRASQPIQDIHARKKSANSIIKQTAYDDYRRNMAAFDGQLTSPVDRLLSPSPKGTPWDYEVAIIGSGYGGSICAARLAASMRPGHRLCVIERGREWVPGTFPDTLKGITGEATRPLFARNNQGEDNPLGLINLLRGDDITVMSASGLGGTSLINANVALRPDRDIFQQSAWPIPLRDRDFLDPYFARAEWELGVIRETWNMSGKMRAQAIAAQNLADCGAHIEASAISITRGPQIGLPIVNRQGLIQRPCTNCGDCMSGCNVGAKNTLAMNYLPIARRFGADIFTHSRVNCIEKFDGYYGIHYTHYLECDGGLREIRGCLKSRIVIVSAGSLASTELLLKSQSSKMQYSGCLGHKWTGNGDILGVVRGTSMETNIGGFGAYEPECRNTGPTIQSNITYPHRPIPMRFLIQDGGVARAYANAMTFMGHDLDLSHTQVVLVMGNDGAAGRIELDERGQAVIRWPGYYHSEYRKNATVEINRTAAALGGKYREMLLWKGQAGTVHPLGGCALSDDPNHGVLNHKGQVFDFAEGGTIDASTGAPRVHDGLYVCDGATLPTSVGVNPYITISALAERTAQLISLEPKYADIFAS